MTPPRPHRDAGPETGGTGRVVVHVGLPKTGTTFLQRILQEQNDRLAAAGVLYPFPRPGLHFHAALDARGSRHFYGITGDEVSGAWSQLCDLAVDWATTRGTALISHEVLALASPEEVERALTPLAGLEVHVVVTARDLGRLVTAQWQERVKHGDRRSFARWQADTVGGPWRRDDPDRSMFWQRVDPVDTLARWTAGLPPGRGHLVVAPQPGAAPDVLWRRFAAALPVDPDAVDPAAGASRSNASLGTPEIAHLRAVHEALADRVSPDQRRRLVKRQYAEGALARSSAEAGSPAPRTPYDLRARLLTITSHWREELAAAGHEVHGDLRDLEPVTGGPEDPHPDDVPRGRVASLAARGVAERIALRAAEEDRAAELERRRAAGEDVGDHATPRWGPGPRPRLVDRLLRRPLLSVVVPAYGTEEYLDDCLRSVLGSSYRRLEVVVVDDGSPDACGEIADAWAQRDRRVRVLHVPNGGLGAARNVGAAHANGELLAFCDSDDLVPADAYRRMVDSLRGSGSDFVTGSIVRLEGDHRQEPPWMRRLHARAGTGLVVEDHAELLGDVFAWNKVYRRGWWEESALSWPEGIRYEDQPTTTRAYLAGRFDVLADVVYEWRVRHDGSSITQQRSSTEDLADRLETKRMVLAAVREHGSLEVEKAALDRVLPGDMHRYFAEIPGCDDEWWALLATGVRELWGDRSLVHSGLVPAQRLVGWLVEQGRRDDAARVVRHAAGQGAPLPRVPDHEVGLRLDLPVEVLDVSSVPPLALAVRDHEA